MHRAMCRYTEKNRYIIMRYTAKKSVLKVMRQKTEEDLTKFRNWPN